MKTKLVKSIALLSAPLLLAACGNDTGDEETNFGEAVDYTVMGIEPGAGTTDLTRNVMDSYDNLDGWELQDSSTGGMLSELDTSIQNEEPIIFIGWAPHYMFQMHDLKLLDDPDNGFGGEEAIHTFTRVGLEEDMPEAHEILDNFYWEVDDMESIMLEALERDFDDVTAEWVEDNRDKIDEWTEGVDEVDGEEIELISIPWDTERASSTLLRMVLEEQGYDVTVTNVDVSVMFQALANGEVDATAAIWLPSIHEAFVEEYGDALVDLGPNLTGTIISLAVPAYVEEIDSIEDLPAPE